MQTMSSQFWLSCYSCAQQRNQNQHEHIDGGRLFDLVLRGGSQIAYLRVCLEMHGSNQNSEMTKDILASTRKRESVEIPKLAVLVGNGYDQHSVVVCKSYHAIQYIIYGTKEKPSLQGVVALAMANCSDGKLGCMEIMGLKMMTVNSWN